MIFVIFILIRALTSFYVFRRRRSSDGLHEKLELSLQPFCSTHPCKAKHWRHFMPWILVTLPPSIIIGTVRNGRVQIGVLVAWEALSDYTVFDNLCGIC